MTKKQKVYISAPITGYDINQRKAWFKNVERQLIITGYIPVNPFDNGLSSDAPRTEHMKADIQLLLQCDAYVRSRDWNQSAGCRTEATVAYECGIKLLYEI